MKFYARGNAFNIKSPDNYPAICLRYDNWNDFGYQTYFHADYYDEMQQRIEIGSIRILRRSYACTILPDVFDSLSEEFCSVGSTSFYKGLRIISELTLEQVLLALRDCVSNEDIYKSFRHEEGFRDSLNRDGMFSTTFCWFKDFKENVTREPRDFMFTFHTPIGKDDIGTLEANFNFSPIFDKDTHETVGIPNRINLVIGKNGCGKTSCLSKLANYFAKIAGSDQQRIVGYVLPFDKVIVISYSLFDRFTKPFELISDVCDANISDEARVINNYVYCGLIGERGVMSTVEMEKNFQKAYALLEKKGRKDFWIKQAKILLSESLIGSSIILESMDVDDYEKLSLSSGQYFLFSIISEIIANIENNSIIFSDEPEMHLHPNAVSNLLKIIYKILEHYESYAIMATHSPIILQEISKKYVSHMIRDENRSYTTKINIETFGSEISSIIDDIFEVDIAHSNYKAVFENLVSEVGHHYSPYDKINDYFDGCLSFQARVFLKSLIMGIDGE